MNIQKIMVWIKVILKCIFFINESNFDDHSKNQFGYFNLT
jgi:hypothetical protein